MTNTSLQKFIPVLGVNCKTEDWDFKEYVINSTQENFSHTDFDNCIGTLCGNDIEDFPFQPSILNLIEAYWFHLNCDARIEWTDDGWTDESKKNFDSCSDRKTAQNQGIYFVTRSILYDSGYYAFEVVYVGKTANFYNRFAQHHKQKAFSFLKCHGIHFLRYNAEIFTEFDLLWAERQYINLLKPILNDCSASCLTDDNGEDAKNRIVNDFRLVYEQAYQQGVKDGFASAKNQMIDWFDSALKMPS